MIFLCFLYKFKLTKLLMALLTGSISFQIDYLPDIDIQKQIDRLHDNCRKIINLEEKIIT
jgi:hypothetical protein